MTPKERLEKILSERKKPLLIDNKVQRLTPKSEFLQNLDKSVNIIDQKISSNKVTLLGTRNRMFKEIQNPEYVQMVTCYTNTDRK